MDSTRLESHLKSTHVSMFRCARRVVLTRRCQNRQSRLVSVFRCLVRAADVQIFLQDIRLDARRKPNPWINLAATLDSRALPAHPSAHRRSMKAILHEKHKALGIPRSYVHGREDSAPLSAACV